MSSSIFKFIFLPSELSLSSILTITLLSSIAIWFLSMDRLDPREPPLARSRIPFIGHLIGILYHHNDYFTIINKRFPGPICTVKIFSSRIYIISSPELTQAAYRSSKDISFDSIVKAVSVKIVGLDQEGIDIVQAEPSKGQPSYMADLHREMYSALAKGPPLVEANKRVLNHLAQDLAKMDDVSGSKPLFRWIRDTFTVASADMLYGSENPVSQDHKFIQNSWDFDGDLGMLALGVLPSIIASKGYAARQAGTKVFQEYYNKGLAKNATELIRGRERAALKYGLSYENMSKSELAILSASVTNTVPTTFYMICYIFADLDLVANLRKEISKIVTQSEQNGKTICTFDHTMIETHCPLLVSSYYETLRLNKTGTSVRAVTSDTKLNNQYLLKKGSMVQIATGVLHSDPDVWGADTNVFNAQRFLNKDSLAKEVKKAQNQSFIPFGGGKSMCPGRYLAFTEITSFAAMMAYYFDVTTTDGSALYIPERRFQKMGLASMAPKDDMNVVVKRRKEFEGVAWRFNTESAEA